MKKPVVADQYSAQGFNRDGARRQSSTPPAYGLNLLLRLNRVAQCISRCAIYLLETVHCLHQVYEIRLGAQWGMKGPEIGCLNSAAILSQGQGGAV